MSRYSCCNRRKGGGKTVIAMYTCKDNLTPLLYSGKIKKIIKNKKQKQIYQRLKKNKKERKHNKEKKKKDNLHRNTQNNVWPTAWVPGSPVKLTHKINHHNG